MKSMVTDLPLVNQRELSRNRTDACNLMESLLHS